MSAPVTTQPSTYDPNAKYRLEKKEPFMLHTGLHFERVGKHMQGYRTYSPKNGENVVMSDLDLERMFGREKFTRLDPRFQPTAEGQARGVPVVNRPNYEAMTEEELVAFAKEEGVDLKGIKKGDKVALIDRIIKDLHDE